VPRLATTVTLKKGVVLSA